MKARTISSADKMENNRRNGQAGARAAPSSDASNKKKVDPTTHQLVLTDSTPNGKVALNKSLSDCTSDHVSGVFAPICLVSNVTFPSRALWMVRVVNPFQIAPFF